MHSCGWLDKKKAKGVNDRIIMTGLDIKQVSQILPPQGVSLRSYGVNHGYTITISGFNELDESESNDDGYIIQPYKAGLKNGSKDFVTQYGLPPAALNSRRKSQDLQIYKNILIHSNVAYKGYNPNKELESNNARKFTEIIAPLLFTEIYDTGNIISTRFNTGSKRGTGYMHELPTKEEVGNIGVDYVYWNKPKELIDKLRILWSSTSAGHINHGYWIFEIMPAAITAIFPIVLFPLMGILNTNRTSMSYMTATNMMSIGGLIIAIAIEHCRLHTRVALYVIKLIGCSPRRLNFGLCAVTMFVSMWIPNTAATAMMIPIIQATLQSLQSQGIVKMFEEPPPADSEVVEELKPDDETEIEVQEAH
ncbi:hypothetical protein JTB14_009887 [Gonioctena quinquepunctata]|nr:hypothetical protein JTB14_009887 [Gonioctena quinquepunctata]